MPRPIRLFLLILVSVNLAVADHPSAQPIFNGKDLTGWSGNPSFWSVQDGMIVGQSTPDHPVDPNTFLIYEAPVENFEFRAEFKLIGETANSGIQYRSKVLDPSNWIVAGYQADMDYLNRYTGMVYEERGRGIMVRPGLRMKVGPGHTTKTPVLTPLEQAPTSAATLKRVIRQGDWNEIHIIARGNHLLHYVNGVLTAEAIDEDPSAASPAGVLALQLHRGPPMIVQFRNLKLTPLP